MVGHSQGEIAAAHFAGALTLEDAALLVVRRAEAIDAVTGVGGMASFPLPAERVRELIAPWGERIVIAVDNGPASCAVAAEPEALAELLAACEEQDVRARVIATNTRPTGGRIEAIRERLLEQLAPISPRPTELPFYSATVGREIRGEELGPEHWYRGLRQPVRFGDTVEAMLAAGYRRFIEPSAHPVLTTAVGESARAQGIEVATIGTLRREEGDQARFSAAVAEAHAHGVEVDWPGLFAPQRPQRVPLPTYPFQRQRYWLAPGAGGSADLGAAGLSEAEHPLLGAAIALPGAEGEGLLLTGRISLGTHPWLGDHARRRRRDPARHRLPRAGADRGAALRGGGGGGADDRGAAGPAGAGGGGAAGQGRSARRRGVRTLAIHSRGSFGSSTSQRTADSEGAEGEWTLNATGTLGPAGESRRGTSPSGRPPGPSRSTSRISTSASPRSASTTAPPSRAWRRLAARRGALRRGRARRGAGGRGGALRDAPGAARRRPAGAPPGRRWGGGGGAAAPFAWSGVRLHGSGAAALRVRLRGPGR